MQHTIPYALVRTAAWFNHVIESHLAMLSSEARRCIVHKPAKARQLIDMLVAEADGGVLRNELFIESPECAGDPALIKLEWSIRPTKPPVHGHKPRMKARLELSLHVGLPPEPSIADITVWFDGYTDQTSIAWHNVDLLFEQMDAVDPRRHATRHLRESSLWRFDRRSGMCNVENNGAGFVIAQMVKAVNRLARVKNAQAA